MINQFYAVAKNQNTKENEYELKELGEEVPFITVGTRASDYWGTPGTPSKTSYIKTTLDHYDRQFIGAMHKVRPIYDIDKFLDFHFNNYIENLNGDKNTFIKRLKYVIIPLMEKSPSYKVDIDLINNWLKGLTRRTDND